jgi:hypothetical protein
LIIKRAKKNLQVFANFGGDGLDSSLLVFIRRPAVKYPIAGSTRDYMKMQMPDKLSSRSAIIAQQVIPIRTHRGRNSQSYLTETQSNLAKKLRRTIVQFFKVLLGNHQSMAVTYGANIQKGKNDLVFVNLRNRNLPPHHFTKDAIARIHSVGTLKA